MEREARWENTKNICLFRNFLHISLLPRSVSEPLAVLSLGIVFGRDKRDGERPEETDTIVIFSVSPRLSSCLSLQKAIMRDRSAIDLDIVCGSTAT